VKEIKTKNKQPMAFVNIADIDGSIDVVVFPDAWEEFKGLCIEGNTVMCSGERSKEQMSLIVKGIYQI
jgi:DNA polymerase III alpha subunit